MYFFFPKPAAEANKLQLSSPRVAFTTERLSSFPSFSTDCSRFRLLDGYFLCLSDVDVNVDVVSIAFLVVFAEGVKNSSLEGELAADVCSLVLDVGVMLICIGPISVSLAFVSCSILARMLSEDNASVLAGDGNCVGRSAYEAVHVCNAGAGDVDDPAPENVPIDGSSIFRVVEAVVDNIPPSLPHVVPSFDSTPSILEELCKWVGFIVIF